MKLLFFYYDRLIFDQLTVDYALIYSYFLNNHLKYFEFLLERRFWLVNSKIELADLTAAAHISCIDYLGDMPWEKFPEIKHWYSRIKSRPSFRSILTDKIIGIPPRGNYALLDF